MKNSFLRFASDKKKLLSMLVPSMTLQEIRKALVTDYEKELNGKLKAIEISSNGKWIRNGRKDFTETIMFTTKSKNNWRITIEYNKGNLTTIPYLVSSDDSGITASHFLFGFGSDMLMHFNTHFFQRYRERGKINIEKPQDLVKHFFRKNTVMLPCYFPMPDGTQQLFCPLTGGIGLGRVYEEGEIHEFKTFVDDSLLREDQKQQIREIWRETTEQLMAELKRRLLKKEGAG
jgi:hypothetical protein